MRDRSFPRASFQNEDFYLEDNMTDTEKELRRELADANVRIVTLARCLAAQQQQIVALGVRTGLLKADDRPQQRPPGDPLLN